MSNRETVINPLMVYLHDPSGLEPLACFDSQPVTQASPEIIEGIVQKLHVKHVAGLPRQKTFDATDADNYDYLTWDRKNALRITRTLLGAVGRPALYALAQTAAFSNVEEIHKGYRTNLWGAMVNVRVEEGLVFEAEEIMRRLIKDHALTVTDGPEKMTIRLPGMNRDAQVMGYEFNPGDGLPRTIIKAVPACEMFMAALIPDQRRLGHRIIRILPYYMEDRELVAQRTNELLGTQDFSRVYSLILGPSGDIKRIRTWFGRAPEQAIVDSLKPLKVDAVASSEVARLNNMYARKFSNDYKLLSEAEKAGVGSPNAVSIEGYDCVEDYLNFLFSSRYLSFPITSVLKGAQDAVSRIVKNVQDVVKANTIVSQQDGSSGVRDIKILHVEGANTNNVVVMEDIPLESFRRADGSVINIFTSLIFSRVKADNVALLMSFSERFARSKDQALDLLIAYMAENEPYYATFFGKKSDL